MATDVESTKRKVTFQRTIRGTVTLIVNSRLLRGWALQRERRLLVNVMPHLKCTICAKYKSRIIGRRNYSDQWITEADFTQLETMQRVNNISMRC